MTFLMVLTAFLGLAGLIGLTPLPELACRLLDRPVTVSERQAAANGRPRSCAVTPLGAIGAPTSPTSDLPSNEDGRALERPAV